MSTQERDLGWKKILRETEALSRTEVAVGIMQGEKNAEGATIAEYAAYNEYGTNSIPSRPFMATSFDENTARIQKDISTAYGQVASAKQTASQAAVSIGERQKARTKNTISMRDFLPRLSARTIAAKKGSTKTLIDSGVMMNSVQIEIRSAGETANE